MREWLRIQFWLWGHDIRCGLLQRCGFVKVDGGYRREGLFLHTGGLKLEEAEGTLVYDRLRLEFTRGGRLVPFREGWARLACVLSDYEQWVDGHCGCGYRQRVLRDCPPLLRPFRRGWKERFKVGMAAHRRG